MPNHRFTAEDVASAPVLATDPTLVVDLPSACGEGPLWNADEGTLYWVDIPPGRLYRYAPDADHNELVYDHGSAIGGYTFQTDGSILLFGERGAIVRWQDGRTETVVASIPAEHDTRFNDVITDPLGRVFCGTMPSADHLARLYVLHLDGSLELLFDDIGLSNGFGFSPDNSVVYHTDSEKRVIYRLVYDVNTGALSERTVLVSTPGDESVPDGMTVDRDGALWSAQWDGRGILRYGPDGSLLGKVPFPVRKASSIAFGGDDLGTAYVTTAGGDARGADEGEFAGSLFRIDLGIRGRAPFRSRIGLT